MNSERKILIAFLDWGLGHATRCMPIIDEKIKLCNKVPKNVIAKNVVTPVTAKANAIKA